MALVLWSMKFSSKLCGLRKFCVIRHYATIIKLPTNYHAAPSVLRHHSYSGVDDVIKANKVAVSVSVFDLRGRDKLGVCPFEPNRLRLVSSPNWQQNFSVRY